MSAVIKVPDDVRAEIEAASHELSRAQKFCVTSFAEYEAAGTELKRIKGKMKTIQEMEKRQLEPAQATVKAIKDFFAAPLSYLRDAEANIKRALGVYDEQQRMLRLEAERKAAEAARKERERLQAEAAKAEQAARERREREEAKARELEAKGRMEQAAAKRQAALDAEESKLRDIEAKRLAAEAMPMQPVVHMDQPKVSGLSARKLWTFEIIDPGLIPREFMLIIPNETAIGAVVRAMRDQTNIPGVRVYQKSSYASTSEQGEP